MLMSRLRVLSFTLGLCGVLAYGAAVGARALTAQPAPERVVASAPIWGANNGRNGYAFLPVHIQGHAATIVINLNCTKCDLSLSTAALAKVGVTLANPAATTFDSLTIGTDVQRHIPLQVIPKPSWSVPGPDSMPTVVGIVGVHFLTTRYDLLYDFPGRRVQLYALPAKHPVAPTHAWLPPGFTAADCGRMVTVPPGAATFTGVEMQLDGHPVTGVLEMGPYIPKMNALAFKTLGLPTPSPRVTPGAPGATDGGHVVVANVADVAMTVGKHMFGTWKTEVLQELDVQELLAPNTPVMLMNLTMLRKVRLFNAVSSGQVCISTSSL
jgi:hypothetical protein